MATSLARRCGVVGCAGVLAVAAVVGPLAGSAPAARDIGGYFTVRLFVRNDTGVVVKRARVLCEAAIGRSSLGLRVKRFNEGRATCVFRLPPGVRGKTVRGTITVLFQGLRVTRTFTHTIR